MAQIKSNEVKFGVKTNPRLPTSRFGTQTTTPQMRGTVDIMGATRGARDATPFIQSMIPGPQSRVPSAAAQFMPSYGALGLSAGLGNNVPQPSSLNSRSTTASSPATTVNNTQPPAQQAPAPTSRGSNIGSQLENIRNQAMGIQDMLNQRNQAATQPTPANQPGVTFPGILSSLLGASTPTKEQERTRKEMERIANENRSIAENAARLSEQYGSEIARVGQLGAGAVAGNLSTGTNVVGSGNAAIASQSASQRMNALAQAQEAALKGTAQQLTAQEQTAQAFQPSLAAALTQQQQQITGLGNAAGLAAPMQIPYSAGGFDPITGQQIAGGFGGWAGYTTAEQVQNLISQYPDSGVQYDPNLTPQQNLQNVQSAISGSPSYQRGTFGAAGASSYIGGQQLGAAGQLTQQVAQLATIGNAADTNFNLMLDILDRGGINDLNQPILNQLQQGISRGLTSDADLVAFRSALQTVRSQYASILGGGQPTDATQMMAAEKIPDTVSAAALQEVERTMKAMINNTVASYNQQISAYSGGGGMGGGNPFAEQW